MRVVAAIGASVVGVVVAACGGLATPDAPPGVIDAATADAPGCSYGCYAPTTTGAPSAVGVAACRTPQNSCGPTLSWLDPIDVCSCSLGSPALFVVPDAQGTANIALLAPPPPVGLSVSLETEGSCYGNAQCADANLVCESSEVAAWVDIPLVATGTRIAIHDDDGTGCTTEPRYLFILAPQ